MADVGLSVKMFLTAKENEVKWIMRGVDVAAQTRNRERADTMGKDAYSTFKFAKNTFKH